MSKLTWKQLPECDRMLYIRRAKYLAHSGLCDGKDILALAKRVFDRRLFDHIIEIKTI